MAIREKRGFFGRHVKVTAGADADREFNFALQEPVKTENGIVMKYNRFLKGDYPSEKVFEKLFASVGFHLEADSTATKLLQGLAKIADDAKVLARDDSDTEAMTTFLQPHHLPTFVQDGTACDVPVSTVEYGGIKIEKFTRCIANSTNIIEVYRLSYTGGSGNTAPSIVKYYNNTAVDLSTTGSYELLDSFSIAPETMTSEASGVVGDEIILKTVTEVPYSLTHQRKVKLNIAGVDLLEIDNSNNDGLFTMVTYECSIYLKSDTSIDINVKRTLHEGAGAVAYSEVTSLVKDQAVSSLAANALVLQLYGFTDTADDLTQQSFSVKHFKG